MSDEYVSDLKEEETLVLSEEAEKQDIIQKRKNIEASISANAWGYSNLGIEAKKAAMSMLSTKTGMYARIPLMCKGDGCPYAETCLLLAHDLIPFGEPCPVETAQIETRSVGYDQQFDLQNANFTDKNLVVELINHDIMLERCKALMTKEGVLVVDVVAGIAENGEEFYRPEVSKHWEAYERITKKRNEIYQLMMATRRDNKDSAGDGPQSISTVISDMLNVDFVIDERPSDL